MPACAYLVQQLNCKSYKSILLCKNSRNYMMSVKHISWRS
uniref:Uncharacterized protein n=1 Tax=Rhizophora mucronata TaxID=61149 RepID=A0A2P2PWJ7_RHIMU